MTAEAMYDRFGMVGNSPQMVHLYEKICRVAPTDATVLIRGRGEPGKKWLLPLWLELVLEKTSLISY